MIIEIKPEETGGEIQIPPSKSISHRAVFAASLANGTSRITNIMLSDDIKATIEAARSFGAEIIAEPEEDGLFTLMITGTPEPRTRDCLIDCGESGSPVRFLIPLAAVDADNTVITGGGRLPERPLGPIVRILKEQGFSVDQGEKELPLIMSGELKSGRFELPGDVSSQFITGLMLALPLLEGDSEIVLTTPLDSRPYVEITIDILAKFGIEIQERSDRVYFIEGSQAYKPNSLEVEGDFSQAAFWLVNGTINKETVCLGLPEHSVQGDYAVIDILRRTDASIEWDPKRRAWIATPEPTRSFRLDAADIPDLVPVLSVAAALSPGKTEIHNAARLRRKESDRLESVRQMLAAFGASCTATAVGLIIEGGSCLTGADIKSYSDHRVAMAAAIASGRASDPVFIDHAECVSKSWPGFWEDFEDCGGAVEEH